MDNFCDDHYSGIIEADGYKQRAINVEGLTWQQRNRQITAFRQNIRDYFLEKNKEKRESLAPPLLDDLADLRANNFFTFTHSSVELLKVELEKAKSDNKDLARELQWYKANYPDAMPPSSSGVSQSV